MFRIYFTSIMMLLVVSVMPLNVDSRKQASIIIVDRFWISTAKITYQTYEMRTETGILCSALGCIPTTHTSTQYYNNTRCSNKRIGRTLPYAKPNLSCAMQAGDDYYSDVSYYIHYRFTSSNKTGIYEFKILPGQWSKFAIGTHHIAIQNLLGRVTGFR